MDILGKMRHPEIVETIREDWLLLKFIKVFSDKYAFMGNQENLIRDKARTLARLFLVIKDIVPDVAQFSDCFRGIYFDVVIDAVHFRTGKGDDIKTPSQALKIGHSLKKCCNILIGEALRKNDINRKEEAHCFLELIENEWNEKVSKHALETLAKRKFNKPQSIPLTEDVVKLSTTIKDDLDKLLKSNMSSINEEKHQRLMDLTLARIIIFNKKRSGEAANITVEQYEAAKVSQEKYRRCKEIQSSLSVAEKKLSERLLLVEIRGKRGRKVPLLLPPEAKQGMDCILKRR